jgi:hypothetical protein
MIATIQTYFDIPADKAWRISPVLIAFGIMDLGTAIWTQIALLKDRSEGVS